MREFIVILLCFCSLTSMAQFVDVTENSQFKAMNDTVSGPLDMSSRQTASYSEISEIYQIPAYDLYQQLWDVENLKSKQLTIPFSNDRLMLILVQAGNNPFEIPCAFEEIVLRYGFAKKGIFHPGIDLKVAPQTLVKSCFDGVVRMAKSYGDYGLLVVIRHYNGLETVYAHLDKLCVKPGQIVHVGDVIGQAGKSGNAKDYVLHFETRFMNEYFDPELTIDFDNETLIKNTFVLSPTDLNIPVIIRTPVAPEPLVKPEVTKPDFDSEELQPEQNQSGNVESSVQKKEYHVVQEGETLYCIALKYSTTVNSIIRLNNSLNPDKISIGQKLRVK